VEPPPPVGTPEQVAGSTRRETALFLALTFGFAWLLWGYWVIAMPPGGLVISPAFIMCAIVGGFAPSLAAIAVCFARGRGAAVVNLLVGIRRPVRWPYVVFALFAVPAATAISCAVQLLAGLPLRLQDPSLLAMALVWPAMAAIGEEFGWRGFLLPSLAPALGLIPSAIVIGLIWGVWHLPADYVGLKGYEELFWLAFLINGPVVLTAHSVVMAWLWQGTGGSMAAVLLYHWSVTASAIVAPGAVGQGWEGILSAAICAAAIWVLTALVLAGTANAPMVPWRGLEPPRR
jgi:uncharacterized protein